MGTPSHPEPLGQSPHWFTTTHWSVVWQARDGNPTEASDALGRLCSTYWPPIYAFLRQEGYNAPDAEDLTQAFFAHLMEKDFLNRVERPRGKFRSFLLAFLKNFLSDERDRAAALKRGGGVPHLSLEQAAAELGASFEPVDALTPDQAFERHWAQTVMGQALKRLREEYAMDCRAVLFEQIKDLEPGERGEMSYADVGGRLGLTVSGVKSAVYRLRQRHREILREEIAHTVVRREDIDDEIRHLIEVLSAA